MQISVISVNGVSVTLLKVRPTNPSSSTSNKQFFKLTVCMYLCISLNGFKKLQLKSNLLTP